MGDDGGSQARDGTGGSRAGVAVTDHERRARPPAIDAAALEAAGLYDPRAPNAAERLELLEWLASRGATIDRMVRAARAGTLQALAGDLALETGPRYTVVEVAERTGLSPEQVEEVSRAFGLPLSPGRRLFTEEILETFRLFRGGVALFGEAPLLRFFRIVGASLARMAEAGVSLFYVTVEGPMRRDGTTERALAEASARAVDAIGAVQIMIQQVFRSHMEEAIGRFRRLGMGRSVDTAHMTIGFVDLVGFTTLSAQLSAHELAAMVEHFEETAYDVVTARGGRLVKLIGDEVMFVTLDAGAACDVGLALFERFAGEQSVTPRGALATGDLVVRGGDYYGPVVNLASRVAELAVPGELLITPAVAGEAGVGRFRFEPAGRRMLKGFPEPVALLTVERA